MLHLILYRIIDTHTIIDISSVCIINDIILGMILGLETKVAGSNVCKVYGEAVGVRLYKAMNGEWLVI